MTVIEKIRAKAPAPITRNERANMKKLMDKKLKAIQRKGGLDTYIESSVMNSVATSIIDLDENEE